MDVKLFHYLEDEKDNRFDTTDIARVWCFLFCFFSCNINCFAQQRQDTVSNQTWIEKTRSGKNVWKLMGIFARTPEADQSPSTLKSEAPYMAYE